MGLIILGFIVLGAAALLAMGVWWRLRSGVSIPIKGLAAARIALLCISGIFAAGMSFTGVATALAGVNKRWFLDLVLYLIPILALPCFLMLFVSLRALSRTFWLLTIVSALTFCVEWITQQFGSYDFRDSGNWLLFQLIPDLVVTLGFMPVSALVQLALMCQKRERMQLETEKISQG